MSKKEQKQDSEIFKKKSTSNVGMAQLMHECTGLQCSF